MDIEKSVQETVVNVQVRRDEHSRWYAKCEVRVVGDG